MILDVRGRQLNVCGSRSTGYSQCAKGAGFVCMLRPGHAGDHLAFGLWPEDPPRLVAQWASGNDAPKRTVPLTEDVPPYAIQQVAEPGAKA